MDHHRRFWFAIIAEAALMSTTSKIAAALFAALTVSGCNPDGDVAKNETLSFVAPVKGRACVVSIKPRFGGPQYLATLQPCEVAQ